MRTMIQLGAQLLCAVLAIMSSACLAATVWAADAPLRVLIFSGQNNHDWRQTTPMLKSILSGSGRFTVEITERPDQCDAATLARYHVILSDWNAFPADAKIKEWPAAMREAFLDYVRRGGGYVVVHSGSSSFMDWADYRQISMGGWGKETGHGPVHAFEVKLADLDHPICRGLKPFQITDELWHNLEPQPRKVLATAFSAKDKGGSGRDEPVAMITEYGQGRCFNLVLGHNTAAMETPGFQILLQRGVEWAGSGKVTITDNGATPTESQMDAELKAVTTYQFGQGRQTLASVEKMVMKVATEPAAKQALAAKLAALLTSEATLESRQFFCRQLSLIGGPTEVPTLAKLLTDTNLTYFARTALERIPGTEAISALEAALAKTDGPIRLGLINSLAVCHNDSAVTSLASLVPGTDSDTASAALQALGKIGNPDALKALLRLEPSVPVRLRQVLDEALLRCASQYMAAGKGNEVLPVLEKLVETSHPASIRIAAFPFYIAALNARGTGNERGNGKVLAALAAEDKTMQTAALRALRANPNSTLIEGVAASLEMLDARLQEQVIVFLGERGETAVLPALAKAAQSPNPAVKSAALVTLGILGNANTVSALVKLVRGASSEEKKLMVEAMARLHGAGVDEAMLGEFKDAPAEVQIELVRALVMRGSAQAIPVFSEAARSDQSGVRREAITALGKLGGMEVCATLITLLDRGEAGDVSVIEAALGALCRRFNNVTPVVAALKESLPPEKKVLLNVLAAVGGPSALAAIRQETSSADAGVAAVAASLLAEWPDSAPLDDLVSLAKTTLDKKLKVLALRGIARLTPQAKDRPVAQRIDLLVNALSFGAEVNEQKALLNALGDIPAWPALKAALAQLNTAEIADEAGLAALKIIGEIGQENRAEAKAALEQVKARCKNGAVIEQATALSYRFGDWQNLSLGATATSPDGLDSDGEASGDRAAIDGQPATYWDEADNQKLYILRVQLQQRSKVVFLRIMGWQQHNYAPRDFEVWSDGKMVKKVVDAQYRNNWLFVELTPVESAVIELKIAGYYGQSPAIRELEIFGKPLESKSAKE